LCYFLRAVNYTILVFKNLLRTVFGPVDWLKGNYILRISWFFALLILLIYIVMGLVYNTEE